MKFSGKKKRKGFSSFAGGSTRGTPESHVPKGMKSDMPATPGVPGVVPGLPGTGSQPKVPKGPEHSPIYGRKAAKGRNYTPFIIFGGVGILVLVCVIIALTMTPEELEPEKAVKAYAAALDAGDAGAIYDLLSTKLRSQFETELRQLKEIPADSRKGFCAKVGVPPEKVSSMKPREYFILRARKTEEDAGEADDFAGADGFSTTACTIEGDRAWVRLRHRKFMGYADIELVKEDGQWKISKIPGD